MDVRMPRPDTRYTWSGGYAIAYQVLGGGGSDIVYLPHWMSNVEGNWLLDPLARFLESLASFCRLVVMDRRGVGCSDRLSPDQAPTLEAMVDDVLAVTEAAYCGRRTFLLGGQETGFVTMLAAATHPDRFTGVILFGAAATFRQTDDMPWQWTQEQFDAQAASFERATSARELGDAYVRGSVPSLAGDASVTRQVGALMSLTSGVGAGQTDARKFAEIDLRELLPTIDVPTLVLHRIDDSVESVESGRYLADRIPGGRLVELPGEDAQPWAGDVGTVLTEIREFVTGTRDAPEPVRRLTTVLFTDIVDSTPLAASLGDREWGRMLGRHHAVVRDALERFRGEEVETAGDGFLATFDGPARAVSCALAIIQGVRDLGLEVRTGLHTGEIEIDGASLHGLAVHIGARIAALAGPSETLVSSTVRDLVAGSGLTFEDAGDHELKGVPERWHLFRVVGRHEPLS